MDEAELVKAGATASSSLTRLDVRNDTRCPLTFGTKVKGLNDAPFKAVLLSVAHRELPIRSARPMFRIMGVFTDEERLRAVAEEFKAQAPQLRWAVFPVCKPILLASNLAHQKDGAYQSAKVKRILQTYEDRLAAAEDSVLADKEAEDVKDKRPADEVRADWYVQFQRTFMEAAGRVFETPEETRKRVTAAHTATRTEKQRKKEEAAAERVAREAAASEDRKRRRRGGKGDSKSKSSSSSSSSKGGGGGKGRIVRGVHTAPRDLMEMTPSHKVAAVVIVPDNTGDGLDEDVLFVLDTFEGMQQMREWLPLVVSHVTRYDIYDVPVWDWVNPQDRIDASTDKLFRNSMRKQLYEQRQSMMASSGGGGDAAGAGAGAGAAAALHTTVESVGAAGGFADAEALLAEADEAMAEFTAAQEAAAARPSTAPALMR